jgi:hypothetical protein
VIHDPFTFCDPFGCEVRKFTFRFHHEAGYAEGDAAASLAEALKFGFFESFFVRRRLGHGTDCFVGKRVRADGFLAAGCYYAVGGEEPLNPDGGLRGGRH